MWRMSCEKVAEISKKYRKSGSVKENGPKSGFGINYANHTCHADCERVFCFATSIISNYSKTFGHHLHKWIHSSVPSPPRCSCVIKHKQVCDAGGLVSDVWMVKIATKSNSLQGNVNFRFKNQIQRWILTAVESFLCIWAAVSCLKPPG